VGLDVANLLLKISGDPDDAKHALSEVVAALRKFDTEEAHAKVAVDGVEEAKLKLDDLDKSLTVIGRRDVTAKVKVNIDDARAKLKILKDELALAAADGGKGGAGARGTSQILGDIDALGQHIESTFHTRFQKVREDAHKVFLDMKRDFTGTLGAGISAAAKAAPSAAASGIGALVEGGTTAAKGIVQLGASAASALGPMGAILALVLAFVPAIVALTASLAGAVAGFSVLAVSFVGVLAPAVLLLLGAIKELAQAYSAVNQRQEQQKSSALAVAQAQQGVHAATEQLSASQHNLKLQTEEAYSSWRAQIRAVHEDLLSVQSAQLGVEGATLSYKEALIALKQFRASIGLEGGRFDDLFKKVTNVDYNPAKLLKDIKNAGVGTLNEKQDVELQKLILNVKQAKLGESQAQDSLHASSEKLSKDRRLENRYLKEGIKAYPAYLSALKEVRLAEEGMVTAERGLAKARAEQAHGLDNLTKEQIAVGTVLNQFVEKLKEVAGVATKGIFLGLESSLKSLFALLKDKAFNTAFKNLGYAIGEVFARLGKMLASPEMRKGLTELVNGSAKLVKTLGSQILLNFIRLFTNLAVAAMPAMLKIVERIGGAFKRWADGSSNVDKLRQKISHIIREFEEWVHLIGALGALIGAFFRDSSQEGDSLTRSLARTFEKWTKFLNTKAGQEEIKKFFKESITLAREFIEVVNDIITVIKKLVEILEPVVEGIEAAAGALGEGVFGGLEGAGIRHSQEAQAHQQHRTIDDANKQLRSGRSLSGQPLTPHTRQVLEQKRKQAEEELSGHHKLKRQLGGLIAGWGGGDRIPLLGEQGEYMLRKEVVKNVGVGVLDRLNATGVVPAHAGAHGRGDTYIDRVVLPPVPGHPTMDPRVAAVKFARELSKRGVGSA
jgi:hypothetical protein